MKAGQEGFIAITMDEGIAHIFVVTSGKTILKSKVEKAIAKNNNVFGKHGASKNKFFDKIIQDLTFYFSGENASAFKSVSCIVVGSPGFWAENFFKYLQNAAANLDTPFLKDVVSKTMTTHISSGYRHSLKEIMGSEAVQQRIKNMACLSE